MTGGTDNHLVLVDVRSFDLTGRQAESALEEAGVIVNRNSIPFDPNGAWYTSGIRLGTPALTSIGMSCEDMDEVADIICSTLTSAGPATTPSGDRSKAKFILSDVVQSSARERSAKLLRENPLYPEVTSLI